MNGLIVKTMRASSQLMRSGVWARSGPVVASRTYASKGDKSGGEGGDDAEKIAIIESNEENYFERVKKSFDDLKKVREHESTEEKRSRLMYQSRKRGTLENGLLLSNFGAEHLPNMTDSQLNEYDKIINGLHNEWDLYYWLTNAVPTPDEFASSTVLAQMKVYCQNDKNQSRIVQPDIRK